MLTTIRTSAQPWHRTEKQQIEHSFCVWYENTTEISLTMPGMRIKESVSLNSILAEILHEVYSCLSVKIPPAHRTSLSYQFSLVPQRRTRPPPETPPHNHATATKSRVRQENTLSGRIPSLSPSLAMKENSVSPSSQVFVTQNQNHV